MKREPVETMSRMALMQEVHRWRERGPALEAVANAVGAMKARAYGRNWQAYAERAFRAHDRLSRLSGNGGRGRKGER